MEPLRRIDIWWIYIANLSEIYRPCIDRLWIDTPHATGCCILKPLPTTRLVSSFSVIIICDCTSYFSVTMHQHVNIAIGKRRTSRCIVTFTSPDSVSLCASIFALARRINGWSLVFHPEHHYSLYQFRQNANSPCPLSTTSGSPKTITESCYCRVRWSIQQDYTSCYS